MSLVKQLETRKIKDLIPYDRNPRNNKDAVDKVLESLNRHGQVKPIVLSAKGKPFEQETIVAGHTTMQALKRFGAKEAFVVVKEFADEAQFVDYNIRDNKAGEFAQWDEQELANLSAEFEIDLDEMGFEDFDIEEESAGNTDEDDVPEVPEEPTAKLGQMWKLGDHRLMCGDSTDRAQVEALMGGEKADMVFTDPPYDYKKMGSGGSIGEGPTKLRDSIAHISSFDPSCIWGTLLCSLGENKAVFVFCNSQLVPSYLNFAICEKLNYNILTWHKTNHIPAANNHHYPDTEYCIFMSKKAIFNSGLSPDHYRKYWVEDREILKEHPTVKPQNIIVKCVELCSNKGGLVTDIFGGSGSTLIACEKTKRKCRMMELDPKYIDVIIERWQNFTGKKAELIES
jgi:DNA modification methylase